MLALIFTGCFLCFGQRRNSTMQIFDDSLFKCYSISVKTINYTKIYEDKKLKGKFVAVEEKGHSVRVIACGKTPREVFKAAIKKGIRKPIITRIPTEDRTSVFYNV